MRNQILYVMVGFAGTAPHGFTITELIARHIAQHKDAMVEADDLFRRLTMNNYGYVSQGNLYDIGKNVSPETFLTQAREMGASGTPSTRWAR